MSAKLGNIDCLSPDKILLLLEQDNSNTEPPKKIIKLKSGRIVMVTLIYLLMCHHI